MQKSIVDYINGLTGTKETGSIIMALIIVICGVLAGRLIYFISEKYLKKIFAKAKSKLIDSVFLVASNYINPFLVFVSLDLALKIIEFGKWDSNKNVVTAKLFSIRIVDVAIIVIITLFVVKVCNILLEVLPELESRNGSNKKGNIKPLLPILKNVGRISIWLMSISIIITKLGYSPVSIITGMGIAGIAVSFAAQNTVANFLSGVFILLDGPFITGDRIKIGEITGEVLEIGIRNTKIQTPENNIIIVPNSNITSKEVINYNKPNIEEKVFYNIGVSYKSDIEKTKKVLLEIIESIKLIECEKGVSILIVKLGSFTVDLQAVFWIKENSKKGDVIDELNAKILIRFKKEKIDIPLPASEILINLNSADKNLISS